MSDNQIGNGDFKVSTLAARWETSQKFVRDRIADGTLDAYRLAGSSIIRIRRESAEAMERPS